MTKSSKAPLTERNVFFICLMLTSGSAQTAIGAWGIETFPPGKVALIACAGLFALDAMLWILRHKLASTLLYPLVVVFMLIAVATGFYTLIMPFGMPPDASLFPYHVGLFTSATNVLLLLCMLFLAARRDFAAWLTKG